MKQFQWFPGHMKKTLEQIQNKLILVDVVLIVLDSRVPISSMNWYIFNIVKSKPLLILFNKTSLSDHNKSIFFINYYKKKGFKVLEIDSKTGFNISKIYSIILSLTKPNMKHFYLKTLKIMIIGIPNVGKSSLINRLIKQKKAKVANIAGVTRSFQWFNCQNKMRLLDTPGVLWHKFDQIETGLSLALVGSIKDTILPLENLIIYFLNYLKKYYPSYLQDYLDLNILEIPNDDLLNIMIKKYSHVMKCNNIDLTNIYFLILKKIRGKCLNQINLDLYYNDVF